MPDSTTAFLEQPIPFINIPLWQGLILALIVLVIYLYMSRKPKPKEFKPLDLKKEIKKDTNKDFAYFGQKAGVYLYDSGEVEHATKLSRKPRPLGYVLSIMKVVWNNQFKRYEPLYKTSKSDPKFFEKMENMAKDVYDKSFKDLDEKQKLEIRRASTEEMRDEYVEIQQVGKKIQIVRGKKAIPFSQPVGTYCLRIARPNFLSVFIAKFLGFGVSYFRFDANQITIGNDMITVNANLQRQLYNDQFVFSQATKNLVEDIGFAKDREAQLQAIANETTKVTFFDVGHGQDVEKLREAYRLEMEKRRSTSESHEVG